MRPPLARVTNDVVGGLVSAAVAVPLAMGYGMFAFVALGDAYFGHGVLAGLYTAVVVGLVCVATGDRTTTIYAPRIVTTFFLGSLIFGLVHADASMMRSGKVGQTLAIVFSIILLGGAFQALFGLTRMGTLIKHTPHPVMAGFQNAAALLLFLVQLGNVLGFARHTPFRHVPAHLASAKPLSVALAVVTMLVMWHAGRITTSVPPLVTALVVGTAAYHVLSWLGFATLLGPVIGPTPDVHFGFLNISAFRALVEHADFAEIGPTIVMGALGLALIASIDALLCARLLARPGERRPGSNAQLVRLGLGNVAAAATGGITSGINLGPSFTNRAYGARTSLSVLVNAAGVLLAATLLLPILGYLPRAVLSAVIMVIAVQHVDPSTIQLVKRLVSGRVANPGSLVFDLFVIVLVATLSIVLNIVDAVFIGIAIAVVLLLLRMSRSLIRRTYRADTLPSRRVRDSYQRAILARHGRHIHVLELEGAVFFGTVERLADAIDAALATGARFIVLDLRRVTDIDLTGGRMLGQLHADLAVRGRHLLVAHVKEQTHWGRMLHDLGVTALAGDRAFPDSDRAIEWAEDQILAAVAPQSGDIKEAFAFEDLELFRGLSEVERAAVQAMLQPRQYSKGDVVIAEGEPGAELFVVVRGTASVHLRQEDGGATRLVSFSAGTVFGELAFLDRSPRSATVVANDDLVCYVLTDAAFEELKGRHPGIAIRLVVNLAREISSRLRRATRTIHHLAS
jgi:MFS superfamily sulfate permease-like transporter